MPTWLITGGSGFLGRHLLDLLGLVKGSEVDLHAAGRGLPSETWRGRFSPLDLNDPDRLAGVVADVAPSVVLHLAGRTPPATLDQFYDENTRATVRLLDSLRVSGRPCRVVLVGSAAELGPVPPEELPVGESFPCRPLHPYGMSKWLATAAGLASRPPLEVTVARVFNPIGPGLPGSQALGRFSESLANGSGPLRLTVGDLTPRRDFVDVRDVARALLVLSERGEPGQVYHVGTGRSHSVGDGLDRLIAMSGREVRVEFDPSATRPGEPEDSRADVRKIFDATGWSPEISWERSLGDLWDDALARRRTGLTGPRRSV